MNKLLLLVRCCLFSFPFVAAATKHKKHIRHICRENRDRRNFRTDTQGPEVPVFFCVPPHTQNTRKHTGFMLYPFILLGTYARAVAFAVLCSECIAACADVFTFLLQVTPAQRRA